MTFKTISLALACLLAVAPQSHAQGAGAGQPTGSHPDTSAAAPGPGAPIRADDRARIDRLDAAAGAAVRQVLATGSQAQIADALGVLKGAPLPIDAVDLTGLSGEWRCRMTKLGGLSPAVTYPPFRCRIDARGDVPGFEKLTGSQRTRGTMHIDGDRLIYLGSTFVQGEEPRDYTDFPPTVDTRASETLPDVGLVEVTGPDRARILFPWPYRESMLNVLSLER